MTAGACGVAGGVPFAAGLAPPDPISLGAAAWWRADSVTLSGSDVDNIADKTGNGWGMYIGTANAPQYDAADSQFNGHPSIAFVDARNEAYRADGAKSLAAGGITYMFVYRMTAYSNNTTFLDLQGATGRHIVGIPRTNNHQITDSTSAWRDSGQAVDTTGALQRLIIRADNANGVEWYLNGSVLGTNATFVEGTPSWASNAFVFHSSASGDFKLADMAMWAGRVDDATRDAIYAYTGRYA